MAAAFNTPLGGIVFAIEELSHQHFHRFKTHLISAVIVAGLVAQWMLGPYLYFGYPRIAQTTMQFLPWAIGMGIIAGGAGAYFGSFLFTIGELVARIPTQRRMLLVAGSGFAMVGIALLCGSHVMGGGTELISSLLFHDTKDVSWGLAVGRIAGPLITAVAGCAGGVLAPSLTAGAMIGAKMALLAPPAHANLLIMLGMSGFLSGVTRAPFTSFVLVLEMTDRHSAIFPMMVTALAASLVGMAIDPKSIYERRREKFVHPPLEPDSDESAPAVEQII